MMMNSIKKYIVTHKLFVALVIVFILIGWVYLQSIFIDFRVTRYEPGFGKVLALMCIWVLISFLLINGISFFKTHTIIAVILGFTGSYCIKESGSYIEKQLNNNDYYYQIGYIFCKEKGNYGGRVGMPDKVTIGINELSNETRTVKRTTFNKLNVGDTIILKVSSRGGIYIKNLFPTREEIERYKVPQHYINGKLVKIVNE